MVTYVTMDLPAHRATAQPASLIELQLLVQTTPALLATQKLQVTLVVRVQTSIVLEAVPDQTFVML